MPNRADARSITDEYGSIFGAYPSMVCEVKEASRSADARGGSGSSSRGVRNTGFAMKTAVRNRRRANPASTSSKPTRRLKQDKIFVSTFKLDEIIWKV